MSADNMMLILIVIFLVIDIFLLTKQGYYITSGGGLYKSAKSKKNVGRIIYVTVFLVIFYLFSEIQKSLDDITFVKAFLIGSIVFSFIVFSLVGISMKEFNKDHKIKNKYPQLSIIKIIAKKNDGNVLLSNLCILSGLMTTIILAIPPMISLFFVFIFLAIHVRQIIFQYRIKKGFYGRNEYEAREIIQFILDNSEDIDFTDGGKPKPIISDQDLESIRQEINALLGKPAMGA